MKVHRNVPAETPAAAQIAARCVAGFSSMELRKPEKAADLLNAIYNRYPEQSFVWSAGMFAWALRNPNRRIFDPLKYMFTCVDNFIRKYPGYQQKAILKRFCDDLPDVYFDGRRWRKPTDQDRAKISFLRSIVEEAARRGMPAREILAERIPPK